jgi:hypothetical protein
VVALIKSSLFATKSVSQRQINIPPDLLSSEITAILTPSEVDRSFFFSILAEDCSRNQSCAFSRSKLVAFNALLHSAILIPVIARSSFITHCIYLLLFWEAEPRSPLGVLYLSSILSALFAFVNSFSKINKYFYWQI